MAFDLFVYAFHDCLQFPGSQASSANIPQKLGERLSQIRLKQEEPRQALGDAGDGANNTGESWTATESAVKTVLTTLLPDISKRVQRCTTIYQLGFDSISAVQIASMLRKIGHDVVASDVIEHSTCKSLARHLDTRTTASSTPVTFDVDKCQTQLRSEVLAHGITMDAVEDVSPCTPLQSAMMAQFIKSGGRDYFNYIDFELELGLSAAALAEALRAVLVAHPMLRTTIVPVEHDDCEFAMVQYHSADFDTSAVVSNERAETFDLQTWRETAARSAARVPHAHLWRIAIVEDQGEAMTMRLAIHHALYDAQSLQMILNDLSRAVMGHRLAPGGRTANVVGAILGQISSAAESSAVFWSKQADQVVTNAFPVLTPLRETSRSLLTESVTGSVSLASLEKAAAISGLTLHVILQAAWTRVLSAYLGEESVVFGVVLSGRNTEAIRSASFPCITTLPVIAANNHSNEILLDRLLQYNTELYKQQHQPLPRIQRWLGRPDSKLFDTLMVYQKLEFQGSDKRPWRVVDEAANVDYPVSIEIEPSAGGQLRYQLSFFGDVLSREQAVQLLAQFDAVVQDLAFHPAGQEADLFKTRPELFSVLPPGMTEIPTTVRFLHQFVELQAQQKPYTPALHFVEGFDGDVPVGHHWTYKQLDDNGNRVAQLLLPHVHSGDIVAIYFDKCPEAYFSILGILKAGCAFLALDPRAPRSRNEFILGDSGASVLVTLDRSGQGFGFSVSVPVIRISTVSLEAVPAVSSLTPDRNLEPSDVCYCLYTSGTTGTPKGCEITHDNAVQCMLAFQHIFTGHWQQDSKWLQFASLHFDVSVLEQYWSWSVGITLVSAQRDLILEDLAGTISRLGITHIDLTPSLARLLHPDDVPSLCRGVFITGGEPLKQEILEAWGSKGVIYNFYGPTEATIGVTVFPRVPAIGRASNIGQQFVNVGSYVLRPGTEQPVLRGAVGELCVSGRLVGKGYLKREDLTLEKFPTLHQFGERVYRTGDLVRLLHDGCFDFLGRADDQVKLRGQRLEIGEINHAIRKGVESVKDVATLVVRNEAQQKDLLVSFVVPDHEDSRKRATGVLEVVEGPEAAERCRQAREACRSKLPGYMVPTYVLQLPYIPLSANNKAELRELQKLFASFGKEQLMALSSSADRTRQPLSASGRTIAQILAKTQRADLDSIILESSIFELGIDSISVLRFSRALKSRGFAHATPSLILRHPLIRDLVGALEQGEVTAPVSESVKAAKQLIQACAHGHQPQVCDELGITAEQIEYIAPCSPLQQGMISRSATDNAYFNTFRFDLLPETSTHSLCDAFRKTWEALPILRTKFVSTTHGCIQVALKGLPLPWNETPVFHETSVEVVIQTTREAWIARNEGSPIHPLEAVLLRGEREAVLVLHIFHGLYDANSLELVLGRVAREYHALVGKPIAQPEADMIPGPSFLDAMCYGPLQDFSHTKDFWLEHLGGAAESFSPGSFGLSVATATRTIPFEPLDVLRTGLQVTHQAVVQAAWVGVLGKHLPEDPTIGIVVSGRNIELDGVETVVGPLFNTVPFHARMSEDNGISATSWASLIRQCHDFNTKVLSFQHVPLRDVQKWCSGGRPLFNTLFSFHRKDTEAAEQRRLWAMADSEPNADYPLALEASLDLDGCLRLLLVAQDVGDGHGDLQLSAMMDELVHVFAMMEENPGNLLFCRDRKATRTALAASDSSEDHVLNGGLATRPDTADEDSTDWSSTVDQLMKSPFQWTEEALLIRHEMAALAEMNTETITETTPLFGLGLDSIDVIKLSARLKKQGIHIKTSDLMKAQTITAILKHLDDSVRNGYRTGTYRASEKRELDEVTSALRAHLVEIGELDEHDIVLPATPLQESMVVGMIASDFALYFNHDILEIAPSVDIQRLKDAWKTIIGGSPILRTQFRAVDDPSLDASYCQVIREQYSPCITELTLSSTDELAKICNAATLRGRKGAGRDDLLQLAFARVDTQWFLVLSIAHALYDGWSLNLIHQDVQAAYEGGYQPRTLVSYVAHVEGIVLAGQPDSPRFWSSFLKNVAPSMFPKDQLNSVQGDKIHRIEAISSVAVSEIASFCKAHATTLQTVGQACWAAVLAAETQSLDVAFGVVLSCRDTESLEELVFPTMNTVVVRSILHGTVSSWLRYMQDNMTKISYHQRFPLRDVQKSCGPDGPLFNTLFIQQRGSLKATKEADISLMRSVGGASAVEYPVCVELELLGGYLTWRVACDAAYSSNDQTSRILQALDQVLGRFICAPDADVLEFSKQGVSVCGLPPVVVKNPAATALGRVGSDESDDEDEWSSLEEVIRQVLAEVAGVPPVSIRRSNNIYHLGLDSISAIKARSLLRRRGISVGFRDMLKAGSISEMAQLVHEADHESMTLPGATNGLKGSAGRAAVPEDVDLDSILSSAGIEKSAIEEVLPASPMQVHMLSVWQNTQGKVFYPCFRYKLSAPVDVKAINTAWNSLVCEKAILRTVFLSTSSRASPVLQVVIRSGAGHQSSHAEMNSLAQPYHSLHAEKNGDTWDLRLTIHHALYDAVSLPAMMRRFATLCSANEAIEATNPAFDWRKRLAPRQSEESQAAKKRFWIEYLAEAESLSLHSEDEKQSSNSRVSVVRRAALQGVSSILDLCRAKGVSLQVLFFATYAEFLASTAVKGGKEKPRRVVFGVYLANRIEDDDTSGAGLYPCLRLVPLCVSLQEERGLFAAAARIQRDIQVISEPTNVEVGLWEVQEWTGITVNSSVNFLGAHARSFSDEKCEVKLEAVEEETVESAVVGESLDSEHGDEWPFGIAGNPVRDAFPVGISVLRHVLMRTVSSLIVVQATVDVEVAVRGDQLTLGIFGPGSMLGQTGAACVIEGVVELMQRLV